MIFHHLGQFGKICRAAMKFKSWHIQNHEREPCSKYRVIRANFLVKLAKINAFFLRHPKIIRNPNDFLGPIEFGLCRVYWFSWSSYHSIVSSGMSIIFWCKKIILHLFNQSLFCYAIFETNVSLLPCFIVINQLAITCSTHLDQKHASLLSFSRILRNDKILADVRRNEYYEKPCQFRKRLMYERCQRIYNSEMQRKIQFLMRKNRVDPFPR